MTSRNLMITFVLGGIWHGAGWTFIMWGFLHGVALVGHRIYSKAGLTMPDWLGVAITFFFVNLTWVFFRSPSWRDAMHMLAAMFGAGKVNSDFVLINDFYFAPLWILSVFLLVGKNSNELTADFKTERNHAWKTVGLIVVNLIFLNSLLNQEFLYFDF
jgi:alginate O-acetyltransferase complex protein AlgI